MSRYKVLPVPSYFRGFELMFGSQDDTLNKVVIAYLEEEEGYLQIEPIFNRDGWYYDREQQFSWQEYKGTAWTKDSMPSSFWYDFSILDSRWLSPREKQAIQTLIEAKICPRALQELLHWDSARSSSLAICRSTRLEVNRMQKNANKRQVTAICQNA